MRKNWSDKELIEEVFLKDASSEFIVNWLKCNADVALERSRDPFYSLRREYEQHWAFCGDEGLRMAVCLYGRDFATLKTLFDEDFPRHHKVAILKNFAFVRDAGLYNSLLHGMSEILIMDLYSAYQENHENDLFFHVFLNPAVPEKFINRLFLREGLYEGLADEDLRRAFLFLFNTRDNNYFARKLELYRQNTYWEDEARTLANTIVGFVLGIAELNGNSDSENLLDPEFLNAIQNFLQSSKELETDGVAEERELLFFINKQDSEIDGDYDRQLISVQLELGNRAFTGINATLRAEKLQKLSKSEYKRLRKIYYKNSSLTNIYELTRWELDRFFTEVNNDDLDHFDWALYEGDYDMPRALSSNSLETLKRIAQLIKKEGYFFAAALALNSEHYQSKSSRSFLARVCKHTDLFFGYQHWPLGNGTCLGIFEATANYFKQSHPEYFCDEAIDALLKTELSILSKDIQKLHIVLEEWQLTTKKSEESTDRSLQNLKRALKENESMVTKIATDIDCLKKSLDGVAGVSNEAGKSVLLKIPVAGRILKRFFT